MASVYYLLQHGCWKVIDHGRTLQDRGSDVRFHDH